VEEGIDEGREGLDSSCLRPSYGNPIRVTLRASVDDERGSDTGGVRELYDRRDFNFAGPWGDDGFIEDYTAEFAASRSGAST